VKIICQDGRRFLYPTDELYGDIDRIFMNIVSALEARNFKVRGLKLEFGEYGSGEQRLRHLERIRGKDIDIIARRAQGLLPGGKWFDIAALSKVFIRGEGLELDETNTVEFYLYKGGDWKKDREWFVTEYKSQGKASRSPRYLRYGGRCMSHYVEGHTHSARCRPTLLECDSYMNREYLPEGDEPKSVNAVSLLKRYADHLREVLDYVESFPIMPASGNFFPPKRQVAFPKGFRDRIFCYIDQADLARIWQGQKDPHQLPEAHRYGVFGSTYCAGMKNPDANRTYGMIPCGLSARRIDENTNVASLRIPGEWKDEFIVLVNPEDARGIYVADHDAYRTQKKKFSAGAIREGRDHLIWQEIETCGMARARTLVPLAKYAREKMQFKEPMIFIGRELKLGEVTFLGEAGGVRI